MLEHIALDTSDVDTDENVSEYRQYAVHEDFQNTVWGLSDTSAAIAERYNYTDPYGQSDSEDGSASALGEFGTQMFHKKRMHGGFIEGESRLYDFRNRWLATDGGAWCSSDPKGYIDSMNRYQAFLLMPTVIIDQFGESISVKVHMPRNNACPGRGSIEVLKDTEVREFEATSKNIANQLRTENKLCPDLCKISWFVLPDPPFSCGEKASTLNDSVMPYCKDTPERAYGFIFYLVRRARVDCHFPAGTKLEYECVCISDWGRDWHTDPTRGDSTLVSPPPTLVSASGGGSGLGR